MSPAALRAATRAGLVAAAAIPLVVLFWGSTGADTTYENHDILLQQLPFARFARECAARGELPFWNPHLWAGTPFLASGNPGALAPLTLATLPLPLGTAFTAQAMLALALAFAGAAALAWRRTRDPFAAAVAGTTFMLCAPVLLRVYAGHVTMLNTIWGLPFAWLAAEALAAGAGPWAVAGLAASVGAMLYGSAHVAYLACLVGGAVVLVRAAGAVRGGVPWRSAAHPLAWFAVAIGLGACLAAPQLLAGFEFAAQSSRKGGLPLEEALYGSVAPHHFPYLFCPFTDGHPALLMKPVVRPAAAAEIEVTYWEVSAFVGLLPLWLAAVAIAAGRARTAGALALAGLALSLGRLLPFYATAWYALPGFGLFRVPGRLLIVFALGAAVAAAEGLAVLRADGEVGDRARRRAPWLAGGLAVLTCLVAVAAPRGTEAGAGEAAEDALLHATWPVLGAVGLALGLRHARAAVAPMLPTLAVLVPLELLAFASGFVNPMDIGTLPWPPVFREYLAREAAGWRVDIAHSTHPNSIKPNDPLRHGLESAGGYDPAVTGHYMQLYNMANGQPWDRPVYVSWIGGLSHLTPLLHCRYILTREAPGAGPPPAPLREVLTADGYRASEYPAPLPRAFCVHRTLVVPAAEGDAGVRARLMDPSLRTADVAVVAGGPALDGPQGSASPPVRVTAAEPHRVVCEAAPTAPALLVLLDAWYPGWTATVDGAPAPVVRTNHAFRGVALPPGPHVVEFRYACRPFRTGLALAGFGLAACVVLVVLGRRRRPLEPPHG